MDISTSNAIDGVVVVPLKAIEDERGAVLHMLRSDSALFNDFGEIYFSEVKVGITKGWKKHLRMTQHFTVPLGSIKLVIVDNRPSSPTCGAIAEFFLGRQASHYQLIKVPPQLWYAFQNIGNETALLANCTDLPHDPNESQQKQLTSETFSYVW